MLARIDPRAFRRVNMTYHDKTVENRIGTVILSSPGTVDHFSEHGLNTAASQWYVAGSSRDMWPEPWTVYE